ncbi:MAG: hypothetical protein NVSMB30_12850 [Hymenobacter sp.]
MFAGVLLGIGVGQANITLTRAGLVAVLAAGLLCLPAQLSGEGAAAIVRDLPGVSRALIAAHATAAEQGFWALESAAALALFSLLLLKDASPRVRGLARLTLLAVTIGFALLARAGSLGGQIRHPEIRAGFGTADEL